MTFLSLVSKTEKKYIKNWWGIYSKISHKTLSVQKLILLASYQAPIPWRWRKADSIIVGMFAHLFLALEKCHGKGPDRESQPEGNGEAHIPSLASLYQFILKGSW